MRDRHYMMIDGTNSMEYGIWLFGHNEFDFPERDVDMIQVPGRSGDLTIDNGRYANIDIHYGCVIPTGADKKMEAFRAFLLAANGYRKIETTFDPDHYRLGVYRGESTPTLARNLRIGTVEIVFNCKPQRFLKVGEGLKEYASGDVIHNPTLYEAKPLIRVYGNGTFSLGSQTVQVAKNPSYIDIDCELQDAFHGVTNLNNCISLLSGKFPTIGAGDTGIKLNGVTKLEIQTRFWTI